MVCTGPIFRRMIVVPLENTITCSESMGTHDDEHDNFCQEGGVIVVQILQSTRFIWSPGMSELFGENDGMYGSHLSQDDSCTIGEHNHMRRIDGDTRRRA